MNKRKQQHVIAMVKENFDIQRRNRPDSQEATDAREENRRLFALLDSHGVGLEGLG